MGKKISRVILVLIFIWLIQGFIPAARAYAADLTINASADIFWDKTGSYDNESNQLYVGYQNDSIGDYGAEKIALRFPLNGTAGHTIQTATLKVYIQEVRNTPNGGGALQSTRLYICGDGRRMTGLKVLEQHCRWQET